MNCSLPYALNSGVTANCIVSLTIFVLHLLLCVNSMHPLCKHIRFICTSHTHVREAPVVWKWWRFYWAIIEIVFHQTRLHYSGAHSDTVLSNASNEVPNRLSEFFSRFKHELCDFGWWMRETEIFRLDSHVSHSTAFLTRTQYFSFSSVTLNVENWMAKPTSSVIETKMPSSTLAIACIFEHSISINGSTSMNPTRSIALDRKSRWFRSKEALCICCYLIAAKLHSANCKQ